MLGWVVVEGQQHVLVVSDQTLAGELGLIEAASHAAETARLKWRADDPRGRPAAFTPNEVERTINRLKNSRAVATRYDKRAYVFHGTVTAAAVRLWLRS